jgi:hypothetical protein
MESVLDLKTKQNELKMDTKVVGTDVTVRVFAIRNVLGTKRTL